MGISYRAKLVYGFEIDIVPVNDVVIRYDENTGKPYEKLVYSHDNALVQRKVIANSKDDPDAFCSGEEIEALEIGETGYESGTKYLGVSIAEVSEYDGDFKSMNTWQIPDAVSAFADKHNVRPSLILAMSCG